MFSDGLCHAQQFHKVYKKLLIILYYYIYIMTFQLRKTQQNSPQIIKQNDKAFYLTNPSDLVLNQGQKFSIDTTYQTQYIPEGKTLQMNIAGDLIDQGIISSQKNYYHQDSGKRICHDFYNIGKGARVIRGGKKILKMMLRVLQKQSLQILPAILAKKKIIKKL